MALINLGGQGFELDEERRLNALRKLDFARPGAIEAYNKVVQDGAGVDAYEQLATDYPLRFIGGPTPMNDTKAAMVLAGLKERFKKANVALKTGVEIDKDMGGRLDTGSLMMNYATSGGYPRGWIGQVKGPESSCKTALCKQGCASTLRRGGRVLWAAAEGFNKPWARINDVPIHYDAAEIAAMTLDDGSPDVAKQAAAHGYNAMHPEGERFSLLVGYSGNELLHFLVKSVEANVFDLIVLDSIAVLRRMTALTESDTGKEFQGGEAKLFNDFCTRMESAFNFVASRSGRVLNLKYVCKCGDFECLTKTAQKDHKKCLDKTKSVFTEVFDTGEPVRTAMLVINQLRERGIGSGMPMRPDAGGGRGLRHTKGYDIDFTHAEHLSTTIDGRQVYYGRRTWFDISKCKIGPPKRNGVLIYYYLTIPGFSQAGRFDMATDLIGCTVVRGQGEEKKEERYPGLAELAGLITRSGAYFYLGEQSFQGMAQLTKFLLDPANAHVLFALRNEVEKWIVNGGY